MDNLFYGIRIMVYVQGLIVKELVVSFQSSVISNPLNPPYQADFERSRDTECFCLEVSPLLRIDRGDRVCGKKDLLFRWMCSTIHVI